MSPTKAAKDEPDDDVASDEVDAEAAADTRPTTTATTASSRPRTRLDLERLEIALSTLDDESLRRGLAGITEKQRQDLALQLNLPRATVHLGDGLAPLVRRKLRGLSVDRQHAVATALTQRANDATVDALGDSEREPEPRRSRRGAARRRRGVRRRAGAPDAGLVRDLRRARAAT